LFRYDLHVHTRYSWDGFCSIAEAVRTARARGLKGIAITDHDTIDGNLEAAKIGSDDFVIIPGVEVSSKDGHILGLGVSEPIPRGLSATETVALIKEQGGLTIAAHPFGFGRRIGMVSKAKFDAIEVFNSRTYLGNRLAYRFAERNGLPMVAGSDAHHPDEIGLAGIMIDCEPKIDVILEFIAKGKASIFGRTLSPIIYVQRAFQKLIRYVFSCLA